MPFNWIAENIMFKDFSDKGIKMNVKKMNVLCIVYVLPAPLFVHCAGSSRFDRHGFKDPLIRGSYLCSLHGALWNKTLRAAISFRGARLSKGMGVPINMKIQEMKFEVFGRLNFCSFFW
jgi:hypothetical protein